VDGNVVDQAEVDDVQAELGIDDGLERVADLGSGQRTGARSAV
jgi:hypothetical protein